MTLIWLPGAVQYRYMYIQQRSRCATQSYKEHTFAVINIEPFVSDLVSL